MCFKSRPHSWTVGQVPTAEQVPATRLALVTSCLKNQEPIDRQVPTVEQVPTIGLALIRIFFFKSMRFVADLFGKSG